MNELDVIRQKIRQKLNELADDLALGSARDYAEYRHLTGIIAGIALVERDIIDLQERQREAE
jgi:hypothetical protein